MSRSTPWGAAQHVHTLFRGCAIVSTAGHGGMMIAASTAERLLTEAARKEALIHGGYFCYEEDCAVEIPLYESPLIRSALFNDEYLEKAGGIDAVLQRMHLSLSTYYVDYLEATGVTPDPENRKTHDARKASDKAKREAPETVFVSCQGERATMLEGIEMIYDGTGRSHYATTASLVAIRKCAEKRILCRMADVELVDAGQLPPACERLAPYIEFSRRAHESNGTLHSFDRDVEYIKSEWFKLVQAEHGWNRDEAQAYIQRHLIELSPATDGKVSADELGVLPA